MLVVDDGPTLTHGAMKFGAGVVAAGAAGAAEIVDPRPLAVGSLRRHVREVAELVDVLPAMGYCDGQLRELEKTINAVDADLVVIGTPIDLTHLIASRHPVRQATYELEEVGEPTLADVLAPIIDRSGLHAAGRRSG